MAASNRPNPTLQPVTDLAGAQQNLLPVVDEGAGCCGGGCCSTN